MFKKKKEGAALMVVIMVVAVMLILGGTILNLGLAQANEVSREDKKFQAHYLARSGAEAVLKAWEDPKNVTKPTGICNTVFLDSTNKFVNTEPSNMIGKFDVNITPNGDDYIIKSVGVVGNVTQTVTATIKAETSTVTDADDFVNGHDLNWYDYNSGQVNTDDKKSVKQPCPPGKKVKLEAKGGKGLKLPNQNSSPVAFEAEQMLFFSPLQILHNSITLTSKLIAFNKPVDFSNNGNGSGALVLKVLGTGYLPNASHFADPVGVVFFENTGYYFKNISGGVILKNSSDIQSQINAGNLELITDPNFKNPTIDAPTKTITTYSIIWS